MVALVALVAGSVGPALDARPALAAGVAVLSIDGSGFGHGVGMPQDGALALARTKAPVEQIMARFYPGTRWTKAGGSVRVGVAESGAPTGRFTLAFPGGGEIRDGRDGSSGGRFPLKVGRGGQVAVSFDGSQYRAQVLAGGTALRSHGTKPRVQWRLIATDEPTTTTLPSLFPTTTTTPGPVNPSPTTTSTAPRPPAGAPSPAPGSTANSAAASAAPPWAVPAPGSVVVVADRGREYRGAIEALAAAGGFRLVNEVDVEDYLRGMGEVRNPSWPAAGLEAQAVAARTYALRAARAGSRPEGFSLFDDDRSQVYLGRAAEYAAMDKAVGKTRGRVLSFDGALAATVYSASAGGITATAPEGFGPRAPDRPYLAVTRYDSGDGQRWHVEVALTDVAARLRYAGIPSVVAVSERGPSGRPLQMTIEGTGGILVVDGTTFASRLGLRSTLFDVGFATAAVAPAPPPPTNLQQLPEGGAVVETAAAPAGPSLTARPLPSLLASAPAFTAVRATRNNGPIPRTFALMLLFAVTWALIVRRSPLAAAATTELWELTGVRALARLRSWREERRRPPPFSV